MCLGIAMRILEINGFTARCEARGIERDVNIYMLQDQTIVTGDFVMVHVGYAIQKVNQQDALSCWEMFDKIEADISNA